MESSSKYAGVMWKGKMGCWCCCAYAGRIVFRHHGSVSREVKKMFMERGETE